MTEATKRYKKSEKGKATAKRYALNHRERLLTQGRHYYYKASYGITLTEYDKIFKDQNGVCAICGLPEVNMRLQVDHDHKTDKVRGLLCLHCNNVLGKARDSIETLEKAIEYLKGKRV